MNKETKLLINNYLQSCLTDSALAKGYEKLTGKDMLESEEGFDFMVEGSVLFNKFRKE